MAPEAVWQEAQSPVGAGEPMAPVAPPRWTTTEKGALRVEDRPEKKLPALLVV